MRVRIARFLIGFVSGLLVVIVNTASAYEASRGPTELVHWDPQKAYSGYTMVKPQRVQGVYLIDMAGQAVNHWPAFEFLHFVRELHPRVMCGANRRQGAEQQGAGDESRDSQAK